MSGYDPTVYVRATRNQQTPKYDREELAIIKQYKERYMDATTPAERRHVVVGDLCLELFNFWVLSRGVRFTELEKERRVDDLLAYVRNRWRGNKSSINSQPTFTTKISTIVWEWKEKEVFQEIAAMMNIRHADSHTKGWFAYLSKAIGNIIENLSEEEKHKIQGEMERRKGEGNPEHVKSKLAKKLMRKRLDDAAYRNYLEMGLLSINFVLRKDSHGVWAVQVHDTVAELLGVRADTFEEENEDLVEEWERSIFAYVESLVEKKEGSKAQFDYHPSEAYTKYIGVDRPTGFPKLKMNMRTAKDSKKTYETVFRRYLTVQYALACGRDDPVPYKYIYNDPKKFISKQYLPKNWNFKEPRNITIEEIQFFFDHIWQRQQMYAADQVFRFKKVTSQRHHGIMLDATYPDRAEREQQEITAPDRNVPEPNVPPLPTRARQSNLSPHEQLMDLGNLHALEEHERDRPSATPAPQSIAVSNPTELVTVPVTFSTIGRREDVLTPECVGGTPHLSPHNTCTMDDTMEGNDSLVPREPPHNTSSVDGTPGGNDNSMNLMPNSGRHITSNYWPQPNEPFIDTTRNTNSRETNRPHEAQIDGPAQQAGSGHPRASASNSTMAPSMIIDPQLVYGAGNATMLGSMYLPQGAPQGSPISQPNSTIPSNIASMGNSSVRSKTRKRLGPDDQAQEEAARWQVSTKRVRKPRQREA